MARNLNGKKSENPPGCADLTGSVAGIIKRKVKDAFHINMLH